MESNLSIVITTKAGDQTHIAMHGFQSEYQLEVLDCYYQVDSINQLDQMVP